MQLVLKYGGWKNRKTIDFYCRYVEVLFRELGDLVDYWLPFNEINAGLFSMGRCVSDAIQRGGTVFCNYWF